MDCPRQSIRFARKTVCVNCCGLAAYQLWCRLALTPQLASQPAASSQPAPLVGPQPATGEKKALLSEGRSTDWVRQELLIPIDGATKVQADAELEKVEDAAEQEVRVARGDRFLREDCHSTRLNLNTADRNDRAAAALILDFIEKSVGWESVDAIDEDLRITENGDLIAKAAVRSYSAEMFWKDESTEGDSAHVVHAHSALAGSRGRVKEFQVALEDRLVTRHVKAAFGPCDDPVDTEIDCRSISMARDREGVDSGFESPEP